MVAETVNGTTPATPDPSSVPPTPSSDLETPSAPAPDATLNTGSDGKEALAPGDEQKTAAPAPKALETYTLAELNAKALQTGLTAQEFTRRSELQRAEENRQRDFAAVEQTRQETIKRTTEAWTKAHERLTDKVGEVLDEHEYVLPKPVQTALKNAFEKEINELYRSGASEPVLESARIETRKMLTELGYQLDAQAQREIGAMGLSDVMEFQREIGKVQGRQEGLAQTADKDHVLVPKAEWAEYQKAKENEKQAAAGDPVPPTRSRASTSGKLTRDAFAAMSPTERAQAWRERPEEVENL